MFSCHWPVTFFSVDAGWNTHSYDDYEDDDNDDDNDGYDNEQNY